MTLLRMRLAAFKFTAVPVSPDAWTRRAAHQFVATRLPFETDEA